MRKYPLGEMIRNFFSVGLGVLCSVGLFYFLFLASAFFPRSWHPVAVLMILLGISAFSGTFLTASFATRNKVVLGLISLSIMIVVYTGFFDETLNYLNYPEPVLQLVCIVIPAIAGIVSGALPSRKHQ